jgi:hypothetical protein
MVHVSETCEPAAPHLLTHVHTPPATVHEAQCTTPIQQALMDKALPPQEPFVDAAYISADLLVHSRDEPGITLRGPTRPSPGWQMRSQEPIRSSSSRWIGNGSRCAVQRAKPR